jgi:hypothetical protein
MADLITRPNLPNPDRFYAELIKAYEALDEDAVPAFSARLILLLTNHIGDPDVILQALEEAARSNPGTVR